MEKTISIFNIRWLKMMVNKVGYAFSGMTIG